MTATVLRNAALEKKTFPLPARPFEHPVRKPYLPPLPTQPDGPPSHCRLSLFVLHTTPSDWRVLSGHEGPSSPSLASIALCISHLAPPPQPSLLVPTPLPPLWLPRLPPPHAALSSHKGSPMRLTFPSPFPVPLPYIGSG